MDERVLLIGFFTWAAANWERASDRTIGETVDLYLGDRAVGGQQ